MYKKELTKRVGTIASVVSMITIVCLCLPRNHKEPIIEEPTTQKSATLVTDDKPMVEAPIIEQETEELTTIKSKEFKVEGWVHTRVNVRAGEGTDTEVVRTLSFGEKVSGVLTEGSEWVYIGEGYVYKELIHREAPNYKEYEAPKTSGFKSYMGYKRGSSIIFHKKSRQYKLQTVAETSEEGVRTVNGRYCVALGSYYTNRIGQYFDLVLENGTVIECILADAKADCHTDSSNRITVANGCMSEFVVDLSVLPKNAKIRGNVSYCKEEWNSPVKYVRVYEENYFD